MYGQPSAESMPPIQPLPLPLVYSCSGCSSAAQLANHLALRLDRAGLGRALLQRLAALAVQRGCGRFEWSVLDWNANAIGFYERMGAAVLPDWRICRVTGPALKALAG